MTDSSDIPESCDYLVIGAGSAGCAVASRLVSQTGARVVVLESGGTNTGEDVVRPSGWAELLSTEKNWAYETTPQEGTAGRVHVWSMGKLLGGSSSVNGMIYMRGAPWDYDAWAQAGNPGWESEKVYEAFRELETYEEGSSELRGTEGPIKVLRVDDRNRVTNAFLEACEECGYRRSPDFNGLDPEGYEANQLNMWKECRQDAGTVFLNPLADRDNLTIVLNASAERLVFEDGRVVEVVVNQGGERSAIRIEGEAILSAGAIASPQLLMLSGVGPAGVLAELGIESEIDLPGVGANLHDHIGVPVAFETKGEYPASEYQLVEADLYCRSDPGEPHYDVQIPFQLFPYVPPGFEGYEFEHGYTLFPGILKPRSRGRVSLRSADPAAPPLIDPAYLTDPEDVRRLIDALAIAREVGSSAAFDEWRKREAVPGEEVRTPEQVEHYVRSSASTYFHPVGTCKMGPDSDCVVGSDLKVHGAENLRVVDASIMPEVPSGNTNIPSMMVGWRAAELILG